MRTEPLKALREAKSTMEFWSNSSPKCPHCGSDYDISENDAWRLYNEDTHEVECPICDRGFLVISMASWSFSTDEQDDVDVPPSNRNNGADKCQSGNR